MFAEVISKDVVLLKLTDEAAFLVKNYSFQYR